eukprot:5936886-Pleurochrysis_carterae.AAC.3
MPFALSSDGCYTFLGGNPIQWRTDHRLMAVRRSVYFWPGSVWCCVPQCGLYQALACWPVLCTQFISVLSISSFRYGRYIKVVPVCCKSYHVVMTNVGHWHCVASYIYSCALSLNHLDHSKRLLNAQLTYRTHILRCLASTDIS